MSKSYKLNPSQKNFIEIMDICWLKISLKKVKLKK